MFDYKKFPGYFIGGKRIFVRAIIFSLTFLNLSCSKFLQVDPSSDNLEASQVFENDGTANSAIAGIYRSERDNLIYASSVYNSLYSDEIRSYTANSFYDNYSNNEIRSNEATLPWSGLYSTIYSCNAAIEGLNKSSHTTAKARAYYTGEAKFNRAFCYFYLVNLFGPVPLITTTDVEINSKPQREDVGIIYNQIVSDLKDAREEMGQDYDFTGMDHIRANYWVATALLARVYLYLNDWKNAEDETTSIIESGNYSLLTTPEGIFIQNNQEAILQWANSSAENNYLATYFIFTSSPNMICTPFLLNAFEPGDLRKSTWIQSGEYTATGETVYYPYKFTTTAVSSNELYTVLRLAEQYLIRAEARAMQNDLAGAIDDINLIRKNHGGLNTPLPVPADQNTFMDIVMRERQVDLFTEGMNRWFDLKRTGRLNAVMQVEKPDTWKNSAALYPIPLSELTKNPRLEQNPGYN